MLAGWLLTDDAAADEAAQCVNPRTVRRRLPEESLCRSGQFELRRMVLFQAMSTTSASGSATMDYDSIEELERKLTQFAPGTRVFWGYRLRWSFEDSLERWPMARARCPVRAGARDCGDVRRDDPPRAHLQEAMSLRSRCLFAVVAALALLSTAACDGRPFGPGGVVLSYEEHTYGCDGCPTFAVHIREDGAVTFVGQAGCAVPGEQQYQIPASEFRDWWTLFTTPHSSASRARTGRWVSHGDRGPAPYTDDRRIHETVHMDEGPSRLGLSWTGA